VDQTVFCQPNDAEEIAPIVRAAKHPVAAVILPTPYAMPVIASLFHLFGEKPVLVNQFGLYGGVPVEPVYLLAV